MRTGGTIRALSGKALAWVRASVVILAAGSAGSYVVASHNGAGDLDPTFGTGGTVTTDFGAADEAQAVAIQPDGKIVVAGRTGFGDFALARYNPDGSLDASLDGDGKLTTDFGGFDTALAVALQEDGKIVVVGQTDFDFALARYEPDGRLDTSFDGDGKLTTDFGGFDGAYDVAIQPDGRIVVAGSGGRNAFGLGGFALARYNPDGTLDTTFDGDGKVETAFGVNDGATAVAVQPDGKIVAAGSTCCPTTDFAVARYNPDGSLDASFDGDGKLTTDLGGDDEVHDLVIQPDGKIVVAGSTITGFLRISDFALARYDADGTLDPSFDGDGKLITDFIGNSDDAFGLALQADGRIVAAGCSVLDLGGCAFGLARYEPDGSLDHSFGEDGKLTTDFSGSEDQANDVALQADGKIVAVGMSALNLDFALARYLVAPAADTVPPSLVVTASPAVLWPPNHELVPVSISVAAADDSGIASIVLVSATSSEPDDGGGDGDTADDIQGAALGTDDRNVLLRAERSGAGAGRVYTLTYRATDGAGNQTLSMAPVLVPHSHSAPCPSTPSCSARCLARRQRLRAVTLVNTFTGAGPRLLLRARSWDQAPAGCRRRP